MWFNGSPTKATVLFSHECILLPSYVHNIHQDTKSARLIVVCKRSVKARLHRRCLLRSFSFWCMRMNGLTCERIRPSVAKLYKSMLLWLNHSVACVRMRKIATKGLQELTSFHHATINNVVLDNLQIIYTPLSLLNVPTQSRSTSYLY